MTSPMRRLTRAAFLAAAILFCAVSTASAAFESFRVRLVDPDESFELPIPPAAPQLVSPSPGILAGDGTPIGDFMFEDEFIAATVTTPLTWNLFVGIVAGLDTFTGFGPNAYYEFSDFQHDPALGTLDLVQVSIESTQNLAGLSSGFLDFDNVADVFRLKLGAPLEMPEPICAGSVNCGEVEFKLEFARVTEVPEPSTYVLLMAGLLSFVALSRRKRPAL